MITRFESLRGLPARSLFLGAALLLGGAGAARAQGVVLDFDATPPPGVSVTTTGDWVVAPSGGPIHPAASGNRAYAWLQDGIVSSGSIWLNGVDLSLVNFITVPLSRQSESTCSGFDALEAFVGGQLVGCAPCCGTSLVWVIDVSAFTGPQQVELRFNTIDDLYNSGGYYSVDGIRLSQADCDGNGELDTLQIAEGRALDCDGDGRIDGCEISIDPLLDQDGNGILDACEAGGPYWFRSPVNGRLITYLSPSTWQAARAVALSMDGHLLTIRNAAEQDWASGVLLGSTAWIGLADNVQEGTFTWMSQEPVGYTAWAPGEPLALADNQDYVVLQAGIGSWRTDFSDASYPAVVESDDVDCDGDLVLDGVQIAADPSLDFDGDGTLDTCVPANYCTSAPNSSGSAATIHVSGSPVVSQANLDLQAEGCAPNQWSYFLMSQVQAAVPGFGGSQGTLCLGLPIVRFNLPLTGQIALTSGTGTRTLSLDFGNLPQGVVFTPGETWHFQLWFRDVNPGPTSNTTDAISVLFR